MICPLSKVKYRIGRLGTIGLGNDMAIDNLQNNMLTLKEVSILLHVHPNTLRRWADRGIIKSYCITPRGDRRFMSRDIDQFLSEMYDQNR